MCKNFVMDLDGTLLKSDKSISDYTKHTLQLAKSKSFGLILASGRPYRLMENYIDELELGDRDIVICRDGQFVYYADGTLIHTADLLGFSDVMYLRRQLTGVTLEAFTDTTDYIFPGSFYSYLKSCIFNLLNKRVVVKRRIPASIHAIEKVKLCTTQIDKPIIDKIKEKYNIYKIMESAYEVNSLGISKYAALQYLASNHFIDLNELLYFGDDENDLECFYNLENTVAVSNAIPAVKERAKNKADTNDNDGVAKFIQEYILR